jgi:hypothetical protein
MLNLCGIVAAILKMATGRNFSMSGINSGHHYLPTYHYVKFYVSIIIHLEVININVQNLFYSNPQVGEKSFNNLQILQIYALIKSPKQRWETYCFCSVSYYYYYYYYYYSSPSPFFRSCAKERKKGEGEE